MISAKKLIKMALKWQRLAAIKRKRIPFPRKIVADKGNFVAYTADHKRFEIPLLYLNSNLFIELLRWGEEEFGLPSDRALTLPCDAVFMEYVVSLIQRNVDKDVEKALLMSLPTARCLSAFYVDQDSWDPQLLICGF